ncbi:hypothetical protein CTA2_2078 [Colletotrichum tanaceti]|uniref:Uncharacterized protein n=1 Tax=Colletotrichum tanaceti TaxID=1306861 RepID=A0A4U6X8U0_9PEZI|nr:hypothetical protein CTA2_2078 [Colletotrichum tanaceti]TKW51980.1 hypothetical protein CTA1_11027 [Colletotrichum tanaceti]
METRQHRPCPHEHCIQCMTTPSAGDTSSIAPGEVQQYRPQSDGTASSLSKNTASTLCASATFCSVLPPRATQPLRVTLIPTQHGYPLDAGFESSPSSNASHPPMIDFDVKTIHSFPVPTPRKEKRTSNNKYGFQQLKTFICKIPRDEPDWQAKRENFALTDIEGVLSAFADIMSPGRRVETASTSKISGYIRHRASEAANCCNRHLYDFGALVFLGECSVALQLGVDADVVNGAMRSFRGPSQTKTEDSTLRKYLEVPARVTRLMERLYPVECLRRDATHNDDSIG